MQVATLCLVLNLMNCLNTLNTRICLGKFIISVSSLFSSSDCFSAMFGLSGPEGGGGGGGLRGPDDETHS